MTVDYRLLGHFEASLHMERALREAAGGIEARMGLVSDDEPCEAAAVRALHPAARLWLAQDDR